MCLSACTRDPFFVRCTLFKRDYTLRFYVDGGELDVQDPAFFMDEEEYTEIKQTLDEMLTTYADLPMA